MFPKNAVSQGAKPFGSLTFMGFSLAVFTTKDPSGITHRKVHVCHQSNLICDYQEFRRMVVRYWAVSQSREAVLASGVFSNHSLQEVAASPQFGSPTAVL